MNLTDTVRQHAIDPQRVLRLAPVWNIGCNMMQYLVWADNVESSTEHESAKYVGTVLRGMAYCLTSSKTLRPSVTRLLNSGTPEQALPWIMKAAYAKMSAAAVVDFLNKEYRAS